MAMGLGCNYKCEESTSGSSNPEPPKDPESSALGAVPSSAKVIITLPFWAL